MFSFIFSFLYTVWKTVVIFIIIIIFFIEFIYESYFLLSWPHPYLPRSFRHGVVFYNNEKLLLNIFTMIPILKLEIYLTAWTSYMCIKYF